MRNPLSSLNTLSTSAYSCRLSLCKHSTASSFSETLFSSKSATASLKTLFTSISLGLILSGCSTIPPVDQSPVVAMPNVPLQEGYELYANRIIPPSAAAIRWQSFYQDPKLVALIELALQHNKDIEQTILAIQKAQAQFQITDNQDLPTVGASVGYSRGTNNAQDKNPSGGYSVGLALAEYELDFWGKIASLKEQALQSYLATQAAKDTAQVSLIANIAKTYVNLSYQLQQLQLAQSTLESRLESLRIIDARFKAGLDSKAPLLQAQASVETAQLSLLSAQSGILKSKNALQYLIGAPIPAELLPTAAVSSIVNENALSPGLPSELLRYRPDVLQAEYALKAAGANIDVARAKFFPSISLSGRLGYASTDLLDLFNTNGSSWSFGPSISVPIFDAGQLEANHTVAQIEREQALARYERAIETAFKEVSDVLADKATLDKRLASQYRLQDNYNELFAISEARYKAQVDNYLSVLDAQRSLFATQQSILALEQERLMNQIELYQVLGGGANLVEPKPIPMTTQRNAVNLLTPEDTDAQAKDAIIAASSATVITTQQAEEILAQQDNLTTQATYIANADLNQDQQPDVPILQLDTLYISPVSTDLAQHTQAPTDLSSVDNEPTTDGLANTTTSQPVQPIVLPPQPTDSTQPAQSNTPPTP